MALIDKASLLMVPSTYEAGTLYNVLPSGNRAPDSTDQNSGYDQTRADFDFDRGSNASATRIGSDGLIKKYRENLLLQSNQFDTTWYNSNSTETGGQADKDGGTSAWLLTKTSANGGIRQNNTTSGVQTFSFYAKAGESNWVKVNNLGSSAYHQANFDLQNGVVGTTAYIIDAKIEDIGNGWYRCVTTYNTTLVNIDIRVADSDNVVSGSSGSVYIQNAQLESGLVASSYLESTSVTGKAGVLVDLPRINYDANGENGALLLEPSRQNLFSFSEYITGFGTSNTGVSIEENATTSPEGVVNAAKIKEDATNAAHAVRQLTGPTLTSGTDYTFSFFAKKGERSIVALSNTIGASNAANCFFDLENGQVLTNQFNSASIEDFGNGWYRCIATDTADAADDYDTRIYTATADNQFSHQGVSGSGLYIYGIQLEAGSYPTSYIPCMGTSETRAADSCDGAGNSDVINSTEGVLFAEVSALEDLGTARRYISLSDGSSNNDLRLYYNNTVGEIVSLSKVGGVTQFVMSDAGYDLTETHKIAVKYKVNDFALWIDGVEVDTDSSGSVNAANTFDELAFNGNGLPFFGNAKQIIYFPTALTDQELIDLTTL